MVAYPGGIVQDAVVRLSIINQPSKGKIQIGDDVARLENVTFRVVPGGHMGILAGSKAPKASWQELAEWLAERSD